jgi:acetyltransferase-like isoleucine patch superfamily enzyme
MPITDNLLLKIKRGGTPWSRAIRRGIHGLFRADPPVPGFVLPLLRLVYDGFYFSIAMWRIACAFFIWKPLFRSRCVRIGKRVQLSALPFVSGHVEIEVGDDVNFAGKVDILCGRFLDHPRLVIGDRSGLGSGMLISVNQEIVIEEDVLFAAGCRISDNDGHPRAADLRAQNAPLSARDIRPVRVCRSAWIGRDCHIMKGVTIGEGAIIGSGSVVISDIPAYAIAMGNPAEVYFRNAGKPAGQSAAQRTSTAPQE